jgi:hypothetical protein
MQESDKLLSRHFDECEAGDAKARAASVLD